MNQGPVIRFPTREEEKARLQDVLKKLKANADEHYGAVVLALPALSRLAEVLTVRSGQPYKLRSLLYSMWNGKPASLGEIVCFDWQIKKDLCAVMLAFGHNELFYTEIENAVRSVGQWDWFLEEWENIELMEVCVNKVKRGEQ